MSPVGWSISSIFPTWLVNSLFIFLLYCQRCTARTLNSSNTGWNTWSEYTPCSQTCGPGFKKRTRTCKSPPGCAYECFGVRRESATCSVEVCCDTVTLTWSSWTPYDQCTKTCGEGIKKRTRNCRGPAHCTHLCPGRNIETRLCNTHFCCEHSIHGWTEWSERMPCSRTCGGGVSRKTRACKGTGTGCAYLCSGFFDNDIPCNTQPCCVQGTDGWANWSSFGSCSKNCGPGTRQRSRVCRGDNNTCHLCLGSYINTQACTVKAERDGAWSAWTNGKCSATCGSGHQTKTRTCTNPAPNRCGHPCLGDPIAYTSCPGLPSCCQATIKSRASISVSNKTVTIESDPDATGVGVVITCQAITCPGDTVQSITLKKIQILASADQRANGVAVDKALLPNTDVSGSLRQSNIVYVFSKIRCQDIGVYHCSTVITVSNGLSESDKQSDAVEVKVLPGRFKVTPVGDTSDLGVDDVLQLNCSGSVGTVGSSTKMEIVWEYRNKDSRQWTRLSSPDIAITQRAEPYRCDKMVMWTILKRTLTAVDDGRTYRCYLVKDGTAHNDKITDDLGYTVLINSVDHSVSRAVLTIDPQQVTVSKPGKLEVYITCRGQKSQNELVNLILALKATGQSTMKQARELAVAHLPTSVENKVPNKNVAITGGLISRVISYTLREACCHDTGTYICTAISKRSTRTKTTTQDKTFDLRILYHRANIHQEASVETGAKFKCTALLRYGQDVSQLTWYWETSDDDPRITPDVLWNRVLPKQGVTIRNTVSTPPHKCYIVSTSTLHFKSLASNQYSKFYRCYIKDGDSNFQNYTTFTKLQPPGSSALMSETTLAVLAVIGSIFLILLVIMIFAVLKRRESMKRREKDVVFSMRNTPRASFASSRGDRPSVYSSSQPSLGYPSPYIFTSDGDSMASRSSYYYSGTTRTSTRSPTSSIYSEV